MCCDLCGRPRCGEYALGGRTQKKCMYQGACSLPVVADVPPQRPNGRDEAVRRGPATKFGYCTVSVKAATERLVRLAGTTEQKGFIQLLQPDNAYIKGCLDATMRFRGRTKMQIQDSVTRMEGSSLSGTRVARGRDDMAREWFVLAVIR